MHNSLSYTSSDFPHLLESSLFRQKETHQQTALIVEDDLAYRPFWEQVFASLGMQVKLEWATNAADAIHRIHSRHQNGCPYSLVVSDIFLEGPETGLDVWKKCGLEAQDFILVSGANNSKYEKFMSMDYRCPVYLRKPLSIQQCRTIVNSVLGAKASTGHF